MLTRRGVGVWLSLVCFFYSFPNLFLSWSVSDLTGATGRTLLASLGQLVLLLSSVSRLSLFLGTRTRLVNSVTLPFREGMSSWIWCFHLIRLLKFLMVNCLWCDRWPSPFLVLTHVLITHFHTTPYSINVWKCLLEFCEVMFLFSIVKLLPQPPVVELIHWFQIQ